LSFVYPAREADPADLVKFILYFELLAANYFVGGIDQIYFLLYCHGL